MKPSGNAVWNPADPLTDTKLNNIENALKALEVLAVAPAASLAGRLVLVTADGRVYRDTGAAVAALALLSDVTNHTGAAVGAHPATAISYAGSANLSATNVEAALDELDTEKAPANHTHGASAISYQGSPTLSATDVEAALDELDADKLARVENNPAPGAGQVTAYWTVQQGGADKFRFTLDPSGNLVLQNYTGGSWQTSATFPLAGGVVTGLNAEKLGGQTLAQVQAYAVAMAIAL